MITVIQRVTVLLKVLLNVVLGQHALAYQTIGIDITRRGMFGDDVVHQRLSAGRLVSFVVATTTVTNQIDHDVTLELHAVVDRQLGDKQHRFRIIAINVKDRRLNHLGDVGTILGGARIVLTASGKTNLVVDDNVDGAARLVSTGLRHLEGFHDYALPGESSVTMDTDGQHFVTRRVQTTILTSAYGTFNHRRHNFQVRRVKRKRQMHLATGGHHVGRKTLVILDVTGAHVDFLLTFKLVKQLARVLAERIDQHVQAATVSHA